MSEYVYKLVRVCVCVYEFKSTYAVYDSRKELACVCILCVYIYTYIHNEKPPIGRWNAYDAFEKRTRCVGILYDCRRRQKFKSIGK